MIGLLRAQGRLGEAATLYRQALAICETKLGQSTPVPSRAERTSPGSCLSRTGKSEADRDETGATAEVEMSLPQLSATHNTAQMAMKTT
jgi:hypothetical protein